MVVKCQYKATEDVLSKPNVVDPAKYSASQKKENQDGWLLFTYSTTKQLHKISYSLVFHLSFDTSCKTKESHIKDQKGSISKCQNQVGQNMIMICRYAANLPLAH